MIPDDGTLRELQPDEELPHVDEVREQLAADPEAPVPEVVEVPPSYLDLTPEQRLALMFGGADRGKDRKAARAGQHTKPRTRKRREREARAAYRAERRARREGGQ